MFGYNPEREKLDNAKENLRRGFAETYNIILRSEDMSDEIKEERISEMKSVLEERIEILNNATTIEDIPEEERTFFGITESKKEVDENIIKTLVGMYAKRAKIPASTHYMVYKDNEEYPEEDIDTQEFEEELTKYFKEHYNDLFAEGYNHFLSEFSDQEDSIACTKDGELVDILKKCNIDKEKFKNFGYTFTIQEGLVSEENNTLGKAKIHYATPEGINNRVNDIYNDIIYLKAYNKADFRTDDERRLKNTYLKYAEEHGIEIVNKDVLEEIEVDNEKVQAIARYINRILKDRNIDTNDNIQEFEDEITKNYSKIMNLTSYNFKDLESVKKLIESNMFIDELNLQINDDSIIRSGAVGNPDIAYGTPEYIKKQYNKVMNEVKKMHSKNAFIENSLDIQKANKEKQALRRYIGENGIEGIDISIPQVEINHDMINIITDALMKRYAENYEDKDSMRTRILKKIEDNYPEMMTEYQCMDISDILKEELKEMGHSYVSEKLYIKDDFVHLSDWDHIHSTCIYATPEALKRNISQLDEIISNRDVCFEQEKARKKLEEYAKANNIELNIPNVETLKEKQKQKQEMFTGFFRDFLPDDPSAREKIKLNDSMMDLITKMSEGHAGGLAALINLMGKDENGIMLMLGLDDMNIRGSQVWVAYKHLYNEDAEKLAKAIIKRDPKMVDFINEELASVDGEKAVTSGASFDRTKQPSKYRFTEKEVEELKVQREDRIAKQKEQMEKMLANSPMKKYRGKEKRAKRENKRQEYRQKLIANGKRSISELDAELTELQEKEKQAKELYEKYEKQLPEKSHQEL